MIKETKNIKKLIVNQPLKLDCGKIIKNFPLAYETYGNLNQSKNNAILVFHALSGDQFVTNINPVTKKEGWWITAVGPGKAIDTDKFFVICVNILGGCMGSFGPKEINPETGELFGTTFPVITIKDMVKAQIYLLEHLGINKLLAITGGSMGGMQVLQFASLYPDKTCSAIPIACSASHSAQNIALNELGRQAIMADTNWNGGNYFKTNLSPDKGLAVARMAAHITYLSDKGLQEKFGRKLQVKGDLKFSFDADFQIESYLRHQGSVFVDRFDANSYLYITRAMDYFDLTKQFDGNLASAFKKTKAKFCVISFSSDWLYPTRENKEIVIALNACGANVGFVEINSDKGHDSFLLNVPKFLKTLSEFINSIHNEINNEKRI
jgi:homoserine O-acetyltransferase